MYNVNKLYESHLQPLSHFIKGLMDMVKILMQIVLNSENL